ncbi:MAG: DUF4349 domain-containing protein [Candidatus Gracilibacteria bacterium]|nr:DUF4349 domain-containing protein [Candidatus Gracilibacteria bacterium]
MKEFLKKHRMLLILVAALAVLWLWYSGGVTMNKLGTMTQNSMRGEYASDDYGLAMAPSAAPMMEKDAIARNTAEESAGDPDIAPADRKLITTANYTIEVEKPEETAEEARVYLASIGGFLDNMEVSEYSNNNKQAYLTMRVPADKFEEATKHLKEYGYVKSENVGSRDVTSQYYDNDEHIKNLEAREAKVREFFNKAKDVEETLSVYRELASLREQIESLKGTQKNLDRQVDYSSIYLTLLPDVEINPISDDEWNLWRSFKKQVNSLVTNLQGLADFAIFLLVKAVIWLPVGLIIYFIWKKFRKSKK